MWILIFLVAVVLVLVVVARSRSPRGSSPPSTSSDALLAARKALADQDLSKMVAALDRGFGGLGFAIDAKEKMRASDAMALLLSVRDQLEDDPAYDRLLAQVSRLCGRNAPEPPGGPHPKSKLVRAAAAGNLRDLERLLDAGESPDLLDPITTWSSLMAAARAGKIDAVRLLLARGAEPNLQNDRRQTALLVASGADQLEAVDLLIAAGADVTAADIDGSTALDHAQNGGAYRVIDRLAALDAPRLKPDPESKRNLELEAHILRDPEVIEPYLVYADWLLDHGDPRGELIMLEHRGEEAKAAELRASFAAQIDPRIEPTWRRGFVHSARVDDVEKDGGQPLDRALRNFLRLSSAALLRELVFARVGTPIEYGRLLEVLAEEGAPNLHRLFAGDFEFPEDCEISWVVIGDLSRLYRALPSLRSLTLQGGEVKLGEIDLPELVEFELRTGTIRQDEIRSIAGARWPKLERLVVWFGQQEYGAESNVEELLPILRADGLPNLRHLGLMNAELTDELCDLLADAPVLKQLKTLSLALGTLSDAGARALASAPVAHLDQIDVSECFLSEAGIAMLRSLGPEIVAERQRSGEDRYAAVGE